MVKIGDVETFREVDADKAQALKVLEEAAEVFGAWQEYEVMREYETETFGEPHDWTCAVADDLMDECADVIQAVVNLIAALGVEDFTPYMEACRKRNEERGRM